MSHGKVVYDLFGHHHKARADASNVADDRHVSEGSPEYLQSSKEKYDRLNPYFELTLVQLATSFEKYTLPDDLYNKLAEAFSIKSRGDTYSIQLPLTVGKLQPLLVKKIGLKWSVIEKDIIRPLIRKHRTQHYPVPWIISLEPSGSTVMSLFLAPWTSFSLRAG
jgi:hypothetical protein